MAAIEEIGEVCEFLHSTKAVMNNAIDLIVVAVYLLGVVGVCRYTVLKRRGEGAGNRLLLASHSLGWRTIGVTLCLSRRPISVQWSQPF